MVPTKETEEEIVEVVIQEKEEIVSFKNEEEELFEDLSNVTCGPEDDRRTWRTWHLLSLGLSLSGILCTLVAFLTYATVVAKTANGILNLKS